MHLVPRVSAVGGKRSVGATMGFSDLWDNVKLMTLPCFETSSAGLRSAVGGDDEVMQGIESLPMYPIGIRVSVLGTIKSHAVQVLTFIKTTEQVYPHEVHTST